MGQCPETSKRLRREYLSELTGRMVQRDVHQCSLFSVLHLELRNLAHDISRNPPHTVTSLNLDRFDAA